MVPSPEPMLAFEQAPLMTLFTKLGEQQENWTMQPWGPSARGTKFPKRPAWLVVLYGKNRDDGDLANHLNATPLEELAERRDVAEADALSLPTVLRTLVDGTQAEKLKLLLQLHRRFYHKPAGEMKKLLHQAGIPIRVLALVEDAVSLCEHCRRWTKTGATPVIKTRLSARFNQLVYIDIVFFDDAMYFFAVDDAIRWTVIYHIDYKDFDSLEKAFRRAWLGHYGPPLKIRCDKESALAHDAFGAYCEKLGIERELILAEEGHSMLGILDRRVQLFREMTPRLLDALSEDLISLENEDKAAEGMHCMNTQMSYGGVTAYQCLYGQHPREMFSDELMTVSSRDLEEALPFFRHQEVRIRAIAAFQEALLQLRVTRACEARPRADLQQNYSVGMQGCVQKHHKKRLVRMAWTLSCHLNPQL